MTATRMLDAETPLPAWTKLTLAAEIAAAYALARWGLRRKGLRHALDVLRTVRRPRSESASCGSGLLTGRRLGRVVTRTLAATPADSRCLMCSLVLTRLLARRGIESSLVIAARPGERLVAHAWIEHDGVALLPAAAPTFQQLVTL